MKKLMTMFATAAMAAGCAWGVERIQVGKVANHYPWDGKVDCTFTLSGLRSGYLYSGLFTLQVEKDGATLSRTVTNDFETADGVYTNTFDCVTLFGEGFYPNGGLAVDLDRVPCTYTASSTRTAGPGPSTARPTGGR